jgi:hypothetical protein
MGITDRSSVRAEVTGGGRSGGGGGGGQGSGGGRTARYSCLVRGLRFFLFSRWPRNEDVRASGRVGRPDGSISVFFKSVFLSILETCDGRFCLKWMMTQKNCNCGNVTEYLVYTIKFIDAIIIINKRLCALKN